MSSPSDHRIDSGLVVGRWLGGAVTFMLLAVALVNPRTTIDHLGPFAGPALVAAMVGMAVIGVGLPWILVAYPTTRQRLTPSNLQGRTAERPTWR